MFQSVVLLQCSCRLSESRKKILYLGVSVYSAEHEFGALSGSNWNLEVLVFEEKGKPEYLVPGEKKT